MTNYLPDLLRKRQIYRNLSGSFKNVFNVLTDTPQRTHSKFSSICAKTYPTYNKIMKNLLKLNKAKIKYNKFVRRPRFRRKMYNIRRNLKLHKPLNHLSLVVRSSRNHLFHVYFMANSVNICAKT